MAFYQSNTPNEVALIQRNNELFQENFSRSQNEQLLYNEWKRTENEKNIIFANMQKLEQQLAIMQRKHIELEKKRLNPMEEEEKQIEYYTDEEELAKETEWIRVKGKKNKKRRMDTSLSPPTTTKGSLKFR